jgi:subfamily B ATP-binding cassette protein MsbA
MQNRQTIPSRQLWRRQMRYVAPHWEVFVLALGSLVAMSATVPVLVALAQPMLDSVVAEKNLELMQLIVLAVIGLFAMRGVAGHIAAYTTNWVGSKMAMDVRVEMFDKLLMLPARYLAGGPDAAVFTVITSGATRLAEAFTAVVTVLVKDTFTIIGLLVWMFYIDWILALAVLSVSAAVWLIMRLTGKRLQGTTWEVGQTMDGLSKVLEESAERYPVVKLYGAEGYEIERLRKQAERIHLAAIKRTAVAALGAPLAQISIAVALGVVIYLAAQHSFADKITVGGVASLAAGLVMLIEPIRRIAQVKESFGNWLHAADSVFSLLDYGIERDEGTITIERACGELKFVHVSCRPDPDTEADPSGARADQGLETSTALRDVTLTIKPGQLVAFVDFSGAESAKSVLINLVPRFRNPTSGEILLDGHDLRSLKLASLRANIALVSAGATEFNDTIAANIAFGAINRATEGNITAAAQAAHASEFIRKLPQGLQTVVGEQEQKLSDDQRLRIAIARALLKDSPILLLDETFDTVDPEAARHVEAAVETVTRGRTTLVFEPRLPTLKRADSIVLLQEGRIIDIGRHRELLARSPPYAQFSRTLLKPEKVVALNYRKTCREID